MAFRDRASKGQLAVGVVLQVSASPSWQ